MKRVQAGLLGLLICLATCTAQADEILYVIFGPYETFIEGNADDGLTTDNAQLALQTQVIIDDMARQLPLQMYAVGPVDSEYTWGAGTTAPIRLTHEFFIQVWFLDIEFLLDGR